MTGPCRTVTTGLACLRVSRADCAPIRFTTGGSGFGVCLTVRKGCLAAEGSAVLSGTGRPPVRFEATVRRRVSPAGRVIFLV